jgi:hypothetical protein
LNAVYWLDPKSFLEIKIKLKNLSIYIHCFAFHKKTKCFKDFEKIATQSNLKMQSIEDAFPNYYSIGNDWFK